MLEKFFIEYSGSVFFHQCIFSDYFGFQINGLGSEVRTNISQAVGPSSNLCRAINFHDSTDILQKFQSGRYGF